MLHVITLSRKQTIDALPCIDQFSNLDGIAGRILGCYEHGPTFFVREILDGIGAQPGGDYIHSVCRHRQVVPQSRLKYHGLPDHRWYEQIMNHEFSGVKIFGASNFFKEFQFKFLITERIQVSRLKHPGN